MNTTIFQAYNEFVGIALAVAFAYLTLIWLALVTGGLASRFRRSEPMSNRPGEVVHQALKVAGRRWDHCRTAALLFCVSFVLLVNFGRYGWWVPMPLWINSVIALLLSVVLLYSALKMAQLLQRRFRLNRLLKIHEDIAVRLVEAQLRGNRVFHSVRLGDVVLDNIVVGRNGIYAVQLFEPAPGSSSVRGVAGALLYQPSGTRIPMRPYAKAVRYLASALSEVADSQVTVMPVAIIPECKIEESAERGPMLVSLQACTSFIGWQDQNAFLMDDDIELISQWLAHQSLENPLGTVPLSTRLLDDLATA